MDEAKRKRLEEAGFTSGTVDEFLGLSEAESAIVEARVRLAKAVRLARRALKLNQTQLAARCGFKNGQARIVRLEKGQANVEAYIPVLHALDVDWREVIAE